MNYRHIELVTDDGDLLISRVQDGTAYDQYDRPIKIEYLHLYPDILNQTWVNPNIEVIELAN